MRNAIAVILWFAVVFIVGCVALGVAYAGPLQDKTREIVATCGSKVLSTYRPGARVAGTRRMSLHASNKAVDVRGNPRCIYRLLRSWPGGVSTDYFKAGHVHFSYEPGGREWGMRFAHGHGRSRSYRVPVAIDSRPTGIDRYPSRPGPGL